MSRRVVSISWASCFGNVTRLLASNSFVRCIFIDFSKVFDTVCHEILLQKLVNFSSPQYVITWLAQFLTDRTQSVGDSTSIQITRSIGIGPGADLTGGHSCSGRRGPWEAGPWRPPGLGGPRRLNFGLQLQSPDLNLNWIYDLFKLETSTLIWRSVLSEF